MSNKPHKKDTAILMHWYSIFLCYEQIYLYYFIMLILYSIMVAQL